MHIFIITIKELFTLLQTVPSVLGTNLWALGVLLLLGAFETFVGAKKQLSRSHLALRSIRTEMWSARDPHGCIRCWWDT